MVGVGCQRVGIVGQVGRLPDRAAVQAVHSPGLGMGAASRRQNHLVFVRQRRDADLRRCTPGRHEGAGGRLGDVVALAAVGQPGPPAVPVAGRRWCSQHPQPQRRAGDGVAGGDNAGGRNQVAGQVSRLVGATVELDGQAVDGHQPAHGDGARHLVVALQSQRVDAAVQLLRRRQGQRLAAAGRHVQVKRGLGNGQLAPVDQDERPGHGGRHAAAVLDRRRQRVTGIDSGRRIEVDLVRRHGQVAVALPTAKLPGRHLHIVESAAVEVGRDVRVQHGTARGRGERLDGQVVVAVG